MRICIVTPSEEFSASAGVRIRYDRLAQAASALGHDIFVQPIVNLQSRGDLRHDVYVFAKTYTPAAALLALRMRQNGCRVGLDVFDDYFTQYTDVRLLRYRCWLADMIPVADFVLCSTPRLAAALAPLTGGMPLCVIADPSDIIDQQLLDHLLPRKATEIAAGEPLRICWFGIGDNPYFPVGLRDLSAFAHVLSPFRGAHLDIVTNTRALNATGLAMLRRLPLPCSITEWTPERERQALTASHVCFLPVNSQSFSRVKSLNRAITALAAGCQVLSAGFPLYDRIGAFIYRSAAQLQDDLAAARPLLRGETLAAFVTAMIGEANPYRGAADLLQLIASVARPAAAISPDSKFPSDVAVLHGSLPDGKLHKLVQRLNGFAVKGPTCVENWNCHLRLDVVAGGRLRIFVAHVMVPYLAPAYRSLCRPHGMIKDLGFDEVMLEGTEIAGLARGWALASGRNAIKLHAVAPRLARDAPAICQALFPGLCFIANDRLMAAAPAMRIAS